MHQSSTSRMGFMSNCRPRFLARHATCNHIKAPHLLRGLFLPPTLPFVVS